MPAIRAVLFDLDGTLIDSFAAIDASLNHVREALGHPVLPHAEVLALVGWGLDRLIAGAFAPAERERARALYVEHHAATCVAGTRLMPGAGEAVTALAQLGYRLAVATNKPGEFARLLLSALGVGGAFEVVIGGDEVTHPKPHPEMLERIVLRLGIAPGEAVYVGDMHLDVEAGHRAHLAVIAVSTGTEDRAALVQAGADQVVASLTELVDRERGILARAASRRGF